MERVRGGRSYYRNDNRPSGGVLLEADVMVCAHCQRAVLPHPFRQRERGWCRLCWAYVCDSPGCSAECHAIDRMVELQIKYPDLPVIERDARGFPTFDLDRLESNHKIYVPNPSPKEIARERGLI